MCIVIYKPADKELYESTLENSFDNNRDGCGFSYVDNGRIVTRTGFFDFEKFIEAYQPHSKKQALLHFRIRTHGDKTESNCQPLFVNDKLVFAHNGVISAVPIHATASDSVQFNNLVLKKVIDKYGFDEIFDPLMSKLLEQYIGSFSKIVMMTADGQVKILNEKEGQWRSGCWFSNESWKPWKWSGSKNKEKYTPPSNASSHKTSPKIVEPNPPTTTAYDRLLPTPQSSLPFDKAVEIQRDPPLQIGDYVRMTQAVGPAEIGWLGKIMAFYENHTIEVYFPVKKRMMRIPLIVIERVKAQIVAPKDYPIEE